MKLERAIEHRETFVDRARKTYTVVAQPRFEDPEPGWEWVSRVKNPLRLCPVIGDCLYNLRSCLDHLMRHLAERTGLCTTSDDFRHIGFPIYESAGAFAKSIPSGYEVMRCVCTEAQREIKAVQPYARRKKPDTDPLWILNQLGNRDKHNLLVTVGVALIEPARLITRAENVTITDQFVKDRGPMVDNEVVARVRWVNDSGAKEKLQVEPQFPVEIVFDETVPLVGGFQVFRVLDQLIAETEAVVARLENLCR